MSLAKVAIEKKTVTGFATVLLLVSGLFAFTQLGQLEDPEFTVKTAVVSTAYPGASAEEVELEVTDRIEMALQEMPQLDYVESLSRAGLSIVTAEINQKYASAQLPQIWDELCKRTLDLRDSLPSGTSAPVVADGILVRLQRGVDRTQAAIEAATQPSWPLLGATVIAVMAFYPIYSSQESAGEYCASLFQVVAISLMLSWVLSVTITPLMCIWLLPEPK